MTITLTTANSRMSTQWMPRQYTWAEFATLCANPKRTKESIDQYLAADRETQGKIKDVGGFMAGNLDGCRRKKQAVLSRTAITLDLDFVDNAEAAWERISAASGGIAVLVYSTHKHTPQKPRLRVVVPFKRPVPPDDYEPIARMWAKHLGVIEMCDATTFEPCRMFYWPSCARDGEFFYRTSGDQPLEPVKVLGLYGCDWRDAANWPACPTEGDGATLLGSAPHPRGGEQQDPLTKGGIVGAFCRAHFPIGQAIEELLATEYSKAGAGRYSYVGSSTSGGLVVYDDKFAYSHHNTDPASGQMCNIFDLCRIHMFGDRDEGSRVKSDDKKPSYTAMCEYAANDTATKKELHRMRLESARQDFDIDGSGDDPRADESGASGDRPTPEGEKPTPEGEKPTPEGEKSTPKEDDDWMAQLKYTKKGRLEETPETFETIIANDPKLRGRIALDIFANEITVLSPMPWGRRAGLWTDLDDANLRMYLSRVYNLYNKSYTFDAIAAVAVRNEVHPVRDYLDSLPQWDGVPRVERVFCDYIGADPNLLTREMTRKSITAAVARIYDPGCKFDYCTTLHGPEGIGKSTALAVLGGKWFSDTLTTTEGKEAREQLRSVWIVEVGELDAIKRGEVTQVKNFISAQVDTYRPAYGRRVGQFPRQCVFFATTNEPTFLKGKNGNRRFWVIPVDPKFKKKTMDELKSDRDQIWAEAKHYYKQGERLYLNPELEAEARKRQSDYNIDADDQIEPLLNMFLDMQLPFNWDTDYDLQKRRQYALDPNFDTLASKRPRSRFCPAEFICERLGKDLGDREYKRFAQQVNALMAKRGDWERVNITKHAARLYGWQRGYKKVEDDL